jgi:hypothetical protein
MNLKRGFRRVAAVLAVIYWTGAALFTASSYQVTYQAAVDATYADKREIPGPSESSLVALWPLFRVSVPDGHTVIVRAPGRAEAERGARKFYSETVARSEASGAWGGASTLLGWAIAFAALCAIGWIVRWVWRGFAGAPA